MTIEEVRDEIASTFEYNGWEVEVYPIIGVKSVVIILVNEEGKKYRLLLEQRD